MGWPSEVGYSISCSSGMAFIRACLSRRVAESQHETPSGATPQEDGSTRGSVPLRHPPNRPVQPHERREHVRLRLRGAVLGLELRAFGVEEGEEVGDSFAVADAGEACGSRALADLIGELDEALLLLAVG